LVWFEKAIHTLTPLYGKDRQVVLAKQFLRNSHAGRAMAHARLGQYAEAVKDWDMAVALSSKPEEPMARAARATARVNAGQVADAVAEVSELSKTPGWSAWQWYDFASVCAVASGKSADKRAAYADRALQLLHRAVKAGFNDAAHMKKDPALDGLRTRADFQKLLAALEKKAAPRLEKQP
jgi:hypothetical protein